MKRKIALITTALLLILSLTAFAAPNKDLNDIGKRKFNKKGPNMQIMVNVVSKLTGISPDDIIKEVKDGKSFFEIAASKGITLKQFKDEVLKAKYEYIDKLLKEGKITEEQAKKMKEKFKSKIEKWDGKEKLWDGKDKRHYRRHEKETNN